MFSDTYSAFKIYSSTRWKKKSGVAVIMGDEKKKKKSGTDNRKRKREFKTENKILGGKLLKYLQTSSSNVTVEESVSQASDSELSREKTVECVVENAESEQEMTDDELDLREISMNDDRDKTFFLHSQACEVSPEADLLPEDRNENIESLDNDKGKHGENASSSNVAKTMNDNELETETSVSTVNLNPRIIIDKSNNTFDPCSLVGMQLSNDEKKILLQMEPCQPSEKILKRRTKRQGDRDRHCSQDTFYHEAGVRRKWASYSLSMDAIFCIPCLMFTDAHSRGEKFRANQGNAFVVNGFSNWKKQGDKIRTHETCHTHLNAKVAEVLFQQGLNVKDLFDNQSKENEERRLIDVKKNRELLERIIDVTLLLGKQGLAFRGHKESLAADIDANNGNFLELLKLLAKYDDKINAHLHKVEAGQKKSRSQKEKGRGSKITFLSDKSQNKLIGIIGDQITTVIVEKIQNCIAWSLIVDSTPDVAHKEQLSICVRIVSTDGLVTEHILACKEANSTTANGLFSVIVKAFEAKNVSFEKLVAQTYDGASNMSGCYNGLQAIIKQKVGKHILYVHCYAHSLNLVLKDTVSADDNVVTLFDRLGSLHNLLNQSMKIHKYFEDAQKDTDLEVITVKRINTVRWSSRELCLKVFDKRYDTLMGVLQKVIDDTSLENKQRAVATGLRQSFLRKNIVATACLFKEIFIITGPLNKYLQSIDMDLGKANALVSGALDQLQRLRDEPDRIIEQVNKFNNCEWDNERRRAVRQNEDESVEYYGKEKRSMLF